MIKLDLYRVFCEVAESRSFSKAASKLYMTQPAVSQSIMQLEKELQIRLFTRTPKGVILTNEGRILFGYIKSAINLIENGEGKIREVINLMSGEMKIGVGDTISRCFLLPYIEKFHKKHSNIRLKVFNGTTIELCAMLKSGEIDIAVCNLPIEDTSMEIIKCLDIHDIFVCGDGYKDELRRPLTFEELAQLPLILLENKSNSRRYVEKHILSKGIRIKPEIELGSHDLLLEFAKIGLGISCVIKEFSEEYLNKGILHEVRLVEEVPGRSVGICFLKSITLSPATEKFIELLLATDV
jgi:DNA-binding transcriptional LysR family regulator